LGPEAVPAAFYPVTEIPRDPQGKIRRPALTEATAGERARRRDAARDASEDLGEVGSALREIWLEALFREEVGADDDFFLIGGDSLAAVICNTRIEERFGVSLPLEAHYEARTLTTLTTTLEKALSDV
jgi:acyl carrier protein